MSDHEHTRPPRFGRRAALRMAGATAAAGGAVALTLPTEDADEGGQRAACVIASVTRYGAGLEDAIRRGLRELDIGPVAVRGKRVLLKPNLVETSRERPHINTHPSVVVAAAEVLRSLGAREVVVGEGPGHRRDVRLVLDESGMGAALRDAGLRFVDLNHDAVRPVPNPSGLTALAQLHLPETLLAADLVVSMPKVKTHHWVGVTGAMKNLFGVMPGAIYGWPKNPLHWHGIGRSILDIVATVRPALAIADGIVGMEGDGPILGSPKSLGCLVMGRSVAAVDATCARLMRIEPGSVPYLAAASGRLGPIRAAHIEQRGETVDRQHSAFELISVPHLAGLRRT